MAAKKKSAFADAQATVLRAFHDLEKAVMGMVGSAPAKASRPAKKKKVKKRAVKKKAAKR